MSSHTAGLAQGVGCAELHLPDVDNRAGPVDGRHPRRSEYQGFHHADGEAELEDADHGRLGAQRAPRSIGPPESLGIGSIVIKVAVVGLGKMGLSHHSIINMHPAVELVGVCDSSSYVLGILKKYTTVPTYNDIDSLLRDVDVDAVIIATPSNTHAGIVRKALDRNLHVFCEKPFTLSTQDSETLSALSRERGVVTQVGYHNRFVGAFREVKNLVDAGAIGKVTHALAEAYGPVVLKQKGDTWRSQRQQGGGSLYDYAAHPIDLLNWYLGEPIGVGGTALNKVFSRETDDEVFSTLYYPEGTTAQVSVSWSDESQRKMTTQITVWGTTGRIYADRQECQVYLRDTAAIPPGYTCGWNVRYTTDLTEPVQFYLRGEEYSAQLDAFVQRVQGRVVSDHSSSFTGATVTDRVIEAMIVDAGKGASTIIAGSSQTDSSKASDESGSSNGVGPRGRSPHLGRLSRVSRALRSVPRQLQARRES